MNQTLYSISELIYRKGITKVIHSPGSRNAPLTISFARNPNITMYSIVDERSAGFIALGMSLKSKEPIVLCCTSGTSLLNYAPAIAEAYYQQVPLIIMSADRPTEWLDQRDGQTINQPGALQNFVKKTYQFPSDLTHPDSQWEVNTKLNESVNLASDGVKGPVHLNFPFREPFYPESDQEFKFGEPRVFSLESIPSKPDWSVLSKSWNGFKKKLVVAGQSDRSHPVANNDFVLVADIIANASTNKAIRHHDLFLGSLTSEQADSLRPELLVTTGKSLISKNLKIFLRKNPPKEHWHFDPDGFQVDTLKHVTKVIKGNFDEFVKTLRSTSKDEFTIQVEANYKQGWEILENKTNKILESEMKSQPFSELSAYHIVMKQLPASIDLHLANSMAVRYANFFQDLKEGVQVFANRGTSGIDGTNGTAVGCSLVSDKPTWLLTGDLSFFYDRNAFFHHYDLSRLKIIIFNNFGGGIFRLIKGPSDQPELEKYFETRHSHSARFTASEYGFDYYKADSKASLEKALSSIIKNSKAPQLIEVFTNPSENQNAFKTLKSKL